MSFTVSQRFNISFKFNLFLKAQYNFDVKDLLLHVLYESGFKIDIIKKFKLKKRISISDSSNQIYNNFFYAN